MQAPKPVVNVTIVERMNKVKTLLLFGHVGIAEDLLNVCELELKELAGMMSSVTGDLSKKLKRVEQLRSLLDDVKAILNQSDDELRASISMPKTEDVVKSLHIIRHNVLVKRTIFRMLSENDELLDKGQTKEVAEMFGCDIRRVTEACRYGRFPPYVKIENKGRGLRGGYHFEKDGIDRLHKEYPNHFVPLNYWENTLLNTEARS